MLFKSVNYAHTFAINAHGILATLSMQPTNEKQYPGWKY